MKPTSPLHVAMLIDAWLPFWGGGQVHVAGLSQTLSTHHHCKIKLFYPSKHDLLSRTFWTFSAIFTVYRYSRRHPIDLIHSHGYSPGLPGKLLSWLLNVPVIHTVHGSNLLDSNSQSLKAKLERFLLTQIPYTAQITVSRNFLRYNTKTQNLVYIPNAVNLADFNSIKVKKYSNPTVVFVGRRNAAKGMPILKKAEVLVKKKFPVTKFLYFTYGKIKGKRLFGVLKRSHLFVLPSRAEGQAITILEAWAAKLPVITTPVGDNPYLIKPGQNGFLVPVGDHRQLAQKIIYLLSHPNLAHKLGQQGYLQVKKDHTWEKVARQTYSLYQQVLASFPPNSKTSYNTHSHS